MDIGKLRDQITIQTYTPGASDGAGGLVVGSYADTQTVWANIEPIEGDRALQNGELLDKQIYKIVVRDVTVNKNSRLKIVEDDQLLTIHNSYTTRRPFETKIIAYANND
jgi:head-tail adaptor